MQSHRPRLQHGNRTGIIHTCDRSRALSVLVADVSHNHAQRPVEVKRMTAHFMDIILITIHTHSFFVGNGYLQHNGATWSGTDSILYHMYLIPDGHNFLDAVEIPYGCSFRKAGDPIPPMYSMFDFTTLPQVKLTGALIYENYQNRRW